MVTNLGMFSLNDWITIPVQLNDYAVGARGSDEGTLAIAFYSKLPTNGDSPAAMFAATFSETLNTGFYAYTFQATTARGFAVGGQYFARVTTLIGGITPATLFTFRMAYSRMMVYTSSAWAQVG